MKTFKELGLNTEILKSLDDLGFVEPSPIQAQSIPFVLESKKDLIALAQTGTGKTAAFSLPILNQMQGKDLEAIVICPTRELCLQIFQDIQKFTKYAKGIKAVAVYGGERIDFQIRSLKNNINIVVGTPGRVNDLIRRKVLKLQNIKWVVLDEADEMLDMGFKKDLDNILEQTPKTRQTLLFSATMSKSVHSIAKKYMTEAQEISIGTKNKGADKVSHEYYVVPVSDRFEALKRILDCLPGVYGILFCRTRRETQVVADKLKQAHYETEAIHGDIAQNMRTRIMDRFKRKQVRLLVATDVAARGIDVSDLTHVINYNLPDQNEVYTHRSGRTGRAEKSGVSISILSPKDVRHIRSLESIIGQTIEHKKVPSGEEICKKQIDNLLEEVKNTEINDAVSSKDLDEFIDKLKKFKKEDLIKYIINHKLTHLMDVYKNARDLNVNIKVFVPKVAVEDGANIRVNFGRNNGIDIKGFFALIHATRLKGIDIGKINIMNDYTVFSVGKKSVDVLLKNLKGTTFRGRKVDANKTNEGLGYQGSPRRGGYGGFNKRRSTRRGR